MNDSGQLVLEQDVLNKVELTIYVPVLAKVTYLTSDGCEMKGSEAA